jgi:hypothetical protein
MSTSNSWGIKGFKKYFLIFAFLAFSCRHHYVLVPPAVNLLTNENIGLITFSVENAKGELDQIATQQFLEEITRYQRGAQVLELGTLDKVLGDIKKETLDLESSKAIGEHYKVKSFFHGKIKISDVKPQLDIAAVLHKSLRVRASFSISVTGRLISAESGATIWTDSSYIKGTLGLLSLGEDQIPYFSVRDQDETSTRLVRDLIYTLTRDFRPTRRRI